MGTVSPSGSPSSENMRMNRSDREARRHDYIAKAEEAEKQARKSRDSASRESWERIARAYRKLAEEM